MPNGAPYVCPRCPRELVHTAEGNVQGFYGRIVWEHEALPVTCPNCGEELVRRYTPKRADIGQTQAA